MLNVKAKKTYLKNPSHCPFCESKNIEGGSIEIDSDYAVQEVGCLDCGKGWFDHYKLCAVEEKT